MVKKLDGGLLSLFRKYNADIICFQVSHSSHGTSFPFVLIESQETKVESIQQVEDVLLHVEGFESFWSFCRVKKVPDRIYMSLCTRA